MFSLRANLLRPARLIPAISRHSIALPHSRFATTMATENPTKRLKTDAPVIGTHK